MRVDVGRDPGSPPPSSLGGPGPSRNESLSRPSSFGVGSTNSFEGDPFFQGPEPPVLHLHPGPISYRRWARLVPSIAPCRQGPVGVLSKIMRSKYLSKGTVFFWSEVSTDCCNQAGGGREVPRGSRHRPDQATQK